MNKSLTIVFLFFFLSTSKIYAQKIYLGNGEHLRNSQIDRMNSERQIKELKNNVLLVRLSTRQPLIDALEKSNRMDEADKIRADQLKLNQEIIANFKAYFDFCPTYFFFSNYSHYIYEGQLDSLIFLDDSARLDNSIRMASEIFYVAEFSSVEQDTAVFVTDVYLAETPDGLEQRNRYAGGGNFGFGALIFKSSELYQLRKPFPYYSRTLESIPLMRRTHKRVIQRTNEALYYYYNRVY